MGLRGLVGLVACMALGACISPDTLRCGELLCGPGYLCVEEQGRCVLEAQATVCRGRPNDELCSVGGSDGACVDGLCVLPGCGNGRRDSNEVCEGADLGAATCLSLGFHDSPGLACLPNCTFDPTDCRRCGDGILDVEEACDGEQLGAFSTCQDLGYYEGGALTCSVACTFIDSACFGRCNDGILQSPHETCDVDPPQYESCLDYSRQAGRLDCSTVCTASLDACVRFGWRPAAVGTEATLSRIWVDGSTVVAVGRSSSGQGVIARTDGTSWSVEEIPTKGEDVWGSGPSDVYVITSDFDVLHSTGGAWTLAYSGVDTLSAIWGSSASDVFVVGSQDAAPKIVHFDGSSWEEMAVDGLGNTGKLIAVHGTGPSDVYALDTLGFLVHYDGMAWTELGQMTADEASGLWARGPGEVYLVGGAANAAVLAWWNGGAMEYLDVPADAGTLKAVWGTEDHVFAAGRAGAVLRYDGDNALHIAGPASVLEFRDLTGNSAGDMYLLGASAGGGQVFHYEGVGWVDDYRLEDESGVGLTRELRALHSFNSRAVYVAGSGIETPHRWTGQQWVDLGYTPTGGDGWPTEFRAIWAASVNEVYFCGANAIGCVRLDDGTSWTALGMGGLTEGSVNGIWGVGQDIYAVIALAAGPGHVLKLSAAFEPPQFEIDYTPSPDTGLNAIWGRAADDIFAVGDDGLILYFDGVAWTPMSSDTDEDLRAIWGPGVGVPDVFAVGANGAIVHFDGTSWSSMTAAPLTPPTLHSLWALTGTGPDDVFAFGEGGVGVHYDGEVWTLVDAQTISSLSAAATMTSDRMWMAGAGGVLRLLDRARRW